MGAPKEALPHGIDLIICNYRTPVDLGHCLASLHRHRPTVPWRLAVVNVDPLEEDENVFLHWQPQLKEHIALVSYRQNVGYATAVNGGAFNRGYDTLGIFNADVRFTENVIDECFHALHSRDDWGVLGPRLIDDQNRITAGGFFGSAGHRTERGFHQRNGDAYSDIRDDAITVSGAAYFIKRSVWDELTHCPDYQWAEAEGAFLPTRHYYEETWCSSHTIAHGYRCVYYGPAYMIHLWHRASKVGTVERFIGESRALYERACTLHKIDI